jgi:hypothetical protein
LREMRTVGEVLMVVAALALIAVAFAAGYQTNLRRLPFQRLPSLDWRTYQAANRLKYFDEHSPSPTVVALLLVAAVGFVLRHYG